MPRCSGECKYVKIWVDNLRDFETWNFRWYDREATIIKGVSGPGRDALKDHARSMNTEGWTKSCAKGCYCDGKWQAETTEKIPLKVGDGVLGSVALCTATRHRQEYVGTCTDKKPG